MKKIRGNKRRDHSVGTGYMTLDELFAEVGFERPETMTQSCCGLVRPWDDDSHLRTELCSRGFCTIWYCQCGAEDMSTGPVGCRHDPENRYFLVRPRYRSEPLSEWKGKKRR